MKKIGFVDYRIDEWHANNYPGWIDEASKALGLDYKVSYAYASENAPGGRTTEEWCRDFGVTRCESIEELCEKSDVILVLAPSNPETHLAFAEAVLPFGKPTYIDKTFAPDTETAVKIFELADRYHTPLFSSSALRYATELDTFAGCKQVITCGGGSNAPEYLIHQAEMVIKLLQDEPVRFEAVQQGSQCVFHAEFAGGASAMMVYARSFPFGICAEKPDGEETNVTVTSDTFGGLIRDILRFYESGEPSFDRTQTINVMRLREGALCALQKQNAANVK